jgi:threonine/homoserine/homoserine lactone efflux protein
VKSDRANAKREVGKPGFSVSLACKTLYEQPDNRAVRCKVVDVALVAIGVGMGFAMAAPVGPVNIMCLQRAVQNGFWAGVTAGAGAVTGDAVFASAAAFGITAISRFIEGHVATLQVLGGLFLVMFGIYTGMKASRERPPSQSTPRNNNSALGMLGTSLTAFALTVTNPATMVGFLGMFSGLGRIGEGPNDYAAAGTLVGSVAAGSLIWWMIISALVSIWRDRITSRWLTGINRVSGFALAICGLALLGAFLYSHLSQI